MSRTGLAALVVANLFVALQTLRHDWGYYEAMLVFWTEVVILGGFNVLRLLIVGVFGAQPLGSWAARWVDLGSRLNRFIYTAFGVGFFVVKFGGFAIVIGLFVVLLPALLTPEGSNGGVSVHQALGAAGPGLLAAAAVLAVSHAVSFIRDFLAGREYQRLTIVGLVFWPYARMVLVAVVLLLGVAVAGSVPGIGRESGFAAVMVLLKLGADLVSYSAEHRWRGAEPKPAVVASAA
ncbi:MAG TPA: DUF6498-containing protein [Gemmatimonadales bacterium]|nr:DUF6498-containing protein [Gemmatimonadales bacterium]